MHIFFSAVALILGYGINCVIYSFANPVYPLLAKSRLIPPFIESVFFTLFAFPQVLVFTYLPSI